MDTINIGEYITQREKKKSDLKAEGYYDLYGAVYRFFQKYDDISTIEEWAEASSDFIAMGRKYRGTPLEELAQDLMVATYKELEKRYKRRKEAEEPPQR